MVDTMRNPRLSLGASCLAVAMLAACSLTDPTEFLVVELTASDTLVAPGDTVELEVRATNYGLHEVKVAGSVCPGPFQVTDATGEVVGPESILCILIGYPPRTLPRGESTTFVGRWSGRGASGARLPEGEYGLQGWVTLIEDDRVYSDVVRVRVSTAPVP